MIDIIRRLPDSVANQIAAGEVIERPASVIKELVENAVDAGADHIQIVVKDAGRTLIQVVDNGKGMSMTDARMAFERHATSKITAADDLFSLHTMGFRGEALPSICAISQTELFTQRRDDKIGTHLVLNGSKVESQEPAVCAPGSNFMVKNLFFNIPARRKYMKSDATELSAIMREFERMALVNNQIHFSFDSGSRKIDLRPGTFKQRIADIWKNNLNLQLLPLDVDTSLVKISGFISRPEFARRRNALQYLIVNGRNMKHPYFRKAILSAYEGLIATDTEPCFFIKFDVDPSTIDVNRSPQKQVIQFENESAIWPILKASVRAALGKFAAAPSIDFTVDPVDVAPLKRGEAPVTPGQDIDPTYNPFADTSRDDNPFAHPAENPFASPGGTPFATSGRGGPAGGYRPRRPDSAPRDWDALYRTFMDDETVGNTAPFPPAADAPKTQGAELPMHSAAGSPMAPEAVSGASKPTDENVVVRGYERPVTPALQGLEASEDVSECIQCDGKYIVTPGEDGLLVIDQYRAHVLILFEEYIRAIASNREKPSVQHVLFPELLSLDEAQNAMLTDLLPQLQSIGFMIETDGERREITGYPAFLNGCEPARLIENLLGTSAVDTADYGTTDTDPAAGLYRRVALTAARSMAIRGGRQLSRKEMADIVQRLFALDNPMFTPDGNVVIRTIGASSIASLFR